IGMLAGAIQATTAWTAIRGRLAEADLLLACLITWAIVAFDRMRGAGEAAEGSGGARRWASSWRPARWAFFLLLGAASLVKGIGFGAVLVLAIVAAVLVGRSDGVARRRLRFPAGWVAVGAMTVTWPLVMVLRHGSGALRLWTLHVTDRLAAHPAAFA